MIRKSQLLVRVTPEEKKSFKLAAKAERKTISDWIREKLLEKTAVEALPAISRFDAAMGSLHLVRKEFEDWEPRQCREAALPADQVPDAGKVMVPNGTSEAVDHPLGSFHVVQPTGDGKPIEVEEPQIICDRCHESGHNGEDCPIPMHLDGGKWVRD